MFRALLIEPDASGAMSSRVSEIDDDRLPAGDVTIDVAYSSINYKDGLAVTGEGKVIRGEFPFVPGIDLGGRVSSSDSPEFSEGDRVLQTGWGLGESHWGGFAHRARVRSDWLIRIPDDLSIVDSMIIGTAGYTAMLAIMALEEHGLNPGSAGSIAVTGASGGVGSFAVALLSRLGYQVVAISGKKTAISYLQELGATSVEPREYLGEGSVRPLDKGRWTAAVDTVGGEPLARLISQMETHATVAACGNAAGFDLPTTVLPFILRGVTLAGIDSNTCPNPRRRVAWKRLANLCDRETLSRIHSRTVELEEVPAECRSIVAGHALGRVVVGLNRDVG